MSAPSIVYVRRLSQGDHSRDFTVDVEPGAGWRVREHQDASPLREHLYNDWHRVELAISRFTVESMRLKAEGWSEADLTPSGPNSRVMTAGNGA